MGAILDGFVYIYNNLQEIFIKEKQDWVQGDRVLF